jgi:hypothetical protein
MDAYVSERFDLRMRVGDMWGWTAGFFEYFVDFGRAAYGEVLPSDNSQQLDDLAQKRYGKRVMDLAVRGC